MSLAGVGTLDLWIPGDATTTLSSSEREHAVLPHVTGIRSPTQKYNRTRQYQNNTRIIR